MRRVCLERGCPHFTQRGPRCPYHTGVRDRVRQAKRGNYYSANNYRGRREECIRRQPWCSVDGCTNTRLTADHVVPGDPTSPLRTMCLRHNVERANRARARRPQGVWGGR